MKRYLMILFLAVGTAFGAAPGVLAQDGAAHSPATPITATIDLTAHFAPDPFLISVAGGGDNPTATLTAECAGFVAQTPTVVLHWVGEADLLRIFVYSDHDSLLVVQTPGGKMLCNDDAAPNLLDSSVDVARPAAGAYKLWVGSAAAGQRIAGFLVITSKEENNLGTFELGRLVARPRLPVQPATPALTFDLNGGAALAETMAGATAVLTTTLTAMGDRPAFQFLTGDHPCNGLVRTQPDYVLNWQGPTGPLHIYLESDQDTTLLVATPDGHYLCNDDASAGQNLNPRIDLSVAPPGTYRIFIGRLTTDEPVTGVLTVTTVATRKPKILAPTGRVGSR